MSIGYNQNGFITDGNNGPRIKLSFVDKAIEHVGVYWVDIIFTKPYQ